ncbi:hypothetical protein CBS147326_6545 [Penicillium roqueforti]|nr:hypothetical protein LCP963914a_3117 [Penicillium roqueforti]KAI2721347.1 hypothetical protein CBS147318_1962 [Penicillium roqueforti]KAI3129306.1 hypothetical protein CBS147326_6545 [Penicillium roqueforti]KAI3169659.1 hypothetical protein DTO039G3_5233 [Penicillium roqueforti]KAI3239785.1 hypothetical protein CBS147310_2415 [Penicillium roqueforti]
MNMLCPPFPVLLQGINKEISNFGQSQKNTTPHHLPRILKARSGKFAYINDELIAFHTIGKTVAITKFEYVLLPIFDLVNQYDTQKANLSVDVLSSALFTCAPLTRYFRERADIFFLNLAIGVRLATELNEVLSETFGWAGFSAGRNPGISVDSTEGMQLQLLPLPEENKYLSSQLPEDLNMEFFAFLFSSNLRPDNVFLKRADETYQLQQRFSQTGKRRVTGDNYSSDFGGQTGWYGDFPPHMHSGNISKMSFCVVVTELMQIYFLAIAGGKVQHTPCRTDDSVQKLVADKGSFPES